MDVPFRAEPSTVSYSVHVGQLWVSISISREASVMTTEMLKSLGIMIRI